jgi:hypothetical protein
MLRQTIWFSRLHNFKWPPNIIQSRAYMISCHFHITFSFTLGHLSLLFVTTLNKTKWGPPLASPPMRDFGKQWSWSAVTYGRFTLWSNVERLSISTNQIARNQEFSLSTHTRGQSPKGVALQIAYMSILFDQGETNSQRKFGSHMNGNPNYGREAIDFFS